MEERGGSERKEQSERGEGQQVGGRRGELTGKRRGGGGEGKRKGRSGGGRGGGGGIHIPLSLIPEQGLSYTYTYTGQGMGGRYIREWDPEQSMKSLGA